MRKNFLIFFLGFLLITTNSLAKPKCDVFYERLKNDYNILELDYERVSETKTFGFDLQVKFDDKRARIEEPGDSDFKIDDYAPLAEVLRINKELKKKEKNLLHIKMEIGHSIKVNQVITKLVKSGHKKWQRKSNLEMKL